MKKSFILSFLLLFNIACFAQKILIQEGSEVIDNIQRTGLYTVIKLDNKTVEKAWEKKLKNYGKVQSSKGVLSITGAEIPGVTSKPGKVYSKVLKTKDGTKVWWAIDLGSSFVSTSEGGGSYRAASQILTDFAAECYRDDINKEIADAEKALAKTIKDHEKNVKEGENLVSSVEKNKQEKINLENKLKENAEDLKRLEKAIQQNKSDQSKSQNDVTKMKEAVEVVKNKLQHVGK